MSAVVSMITCRPSCGGRVPRAHLGVSPFLPGANPSVLRRLVNSGTKAGVVSFVEQKLPPPCGAQAWVPMSLAPVSLEVLSDKVKMASGVEGSLGHNQTLRN